MSKHRHIPRRPGVRVIDGKGYEQILTRQVLKPGKRKASIHPWAHLLRASRDGVSEKGLAHLRAEAGIVR